MNSYANIWSTFYLRHSGNTRCVKKCLPSSSDPQKRRDSKYSVAISTVTFLFRQRNNTIQPKIYSDCSATNNSKNKTKTSRKHARYYDIYINRDHGKPSGSIARMGK